MSEDGRRFCENCGTEIRQTTNFCPNCGAAQRPGLEVPIGPPPLIPETGRIGTPNISGASLPSEQSKQPNESEKSDEGNRPPGNEALATYRSLGLSLTAKPTRVWIYDGHIELNQFVDPIRRNQQRARYDQIAQVYTRKSLLFAELIIETRGAGTLRVPGLSKGSADEAASLILERM